MIWPTYIKPWYMRFPYHAYRCVGSYGLLLFIKRWGYRRAQLLEDKYGPFAPGRGYWQVSYDADGKRGLKRSPGMPDL